MAGNKGAAGEEMTVCQVLPVAGADDLRARMLYDIIGINFVNRLISID
jgi:hypothetical protein